MNIQEIIYGSRSSIKKKAFDEGYNKGYRDGRMDGYNDGHNDGSQEKTPYKMKVETIMRGRSLMEKIDQLTASLESFELNRNQGFSLLNNNIQLRRDTKEEIEKMVEKSIKDDIKKLQKELSELTDK